MTNVLASSLTGASRRAIIRAQLPGLIARGVGQQDALRSFRQAGLGIREGDFGRIYREIAGSEERSSRIQFVTQASQVTENVLDRSRIPFTARYRIGFEIEAEHTLTGERSIRSFSLDLDTLGRRSDLEELARSLFDEGDSFPLERALRVRVRRGYYFEEAF